MESEKSLDAASETPGEAIAAFATAEEADRPVAGVAAAARAVRTLADRGAGSVRLRLGDGGTLSLLSRADVARLAGPIPVTVEPGTGPAAPVPTAWEVVRTTGKAGDGLVSRWLNRPLSQRVTWLVLRIPGIRPAHVTIFNAALALPMLLFLLFGGSAGLVLGAILFQAASILDGVDGEMARATHRASRKGASFDSLVDMATNFLFVLGLTVHLAMRDHDAIGWIGAWAILVLVVGNLLIGRRVRAQGAPLGFDLLKRRGRRFSSVGDFLYGIVQLLTGRDCFAFLFMVLAVTGLERVALAIFAGVGTIWFFYVLLASLLLPARSYRGA